MIDVNEAYKLEEIEDFIDSKANDLNDLSESYEFLLRRLNTFINEYTEKVNAFSEAMNKQIDDIHTTINTFESIYQNSLKELEEKTDSLKDIKISDNNELSSKLEADLKKKLEDEINALKSQSNVVLKDYMDKYKRVTELINKINSRLNKLKAREIKEK
ncbi:MAG: hypothetical protein K6A63_03955 [Acholeplasmatales bacterium]|nr:hypothetical protein [Acholeplasmatales bacterium]